MNTIKRNALASAAITSAAISLGLTQAASALPPAPTYDWTGFYIGGNIGYSWGSSNAYAWAGSVDIWNRGLHPDGVLGGVQGGYNWQLYRNVFIGFESDYQWSGQKTQKPASFVCDTEGGCPRVSGTVWSELSWLATERGRIGFTLEGRPNLLWYGTAGVAIGGVKTAARVCDSEGGCHEISDRTTKVGVVVGVGVEGLLPLSPWTGRVTAYPNSALTWKAEYLHVDLGTLHGTWSGMPYTNHMTDDILRVGVNYRFSTH
jgi:outer membrane immunogenic protein